MLQATYSRKYVEAVDRLFDEFRQRTAAIAESVGMKIYYLVPLHPLEREKPRFTHRLAYRATEVASLDSSQLQLFSEGWCRAGVFAPNGHHRSGPRPRCSICRWIWRLSVVRVCGPRSWRSRRRKRRERPEGEQCFNCCLANGRDRPHVPRASTNQCNSRRRQGGEAPISSLFAVRMIAYFGSYRPIGSAANYSVCKTIFLEGSSFVVFQH
jgi:hypothetical protein